MHDFFIDQVQKNLTSRDNRNTIDIYVLILHPVTLLNFLICSSNLCVCVCVPVKYACIPYMIVYMKDHVLYYLRYFCFLLSNLHDFNFFLLLYVSGYTLQYNLAGWIFFSSSVCCTGSYPRGHRCKPGMKHWFKCGDMCLPGLLAHRDYASLLVSSGMG